MGGLVFGGGWPAYVVLMPTIKLFGESMLAPRYPATTLIKDMSAGEIRAAYVFYIGAGAVATGGIIALARALPTIGGTVPPGFASLRRSPGGQAAAHRLPTADRPPLTATALGSLASAVRV